ncbi:MAG: O-methyltransferase [Bacilli bacterium]
MKTFEEMEKYALEENIPIMEKSGISYLQKFILDNNITSILEIGSAIGYSAIKMASIKNDVTITTIERDIKRFNIAKKNIEDFNMTNRISIFNCDALEFDENKKYDLIFIDAAKSQYIKFFEKYKQNLNKNGFIITDNISFHNMIYNIDSIKNRNTKQLVKKILNFKKYLDENEEFITTYILVGDKIAISMKNSN